MKKLLWKIILILAIPSTLYCGYEAFIILNSKSLTLAWLTTMLFLVQILTIIEELMKHE